MIDWFYDKNVTFKCDDGYIDNDGNYITNQTGELTVACDVQPMDIEVVIKDKMGGFISAEYKVFCDANELIKDCNIAIYNDKEYEIIKITDWDDFYIVYLKAVF